jgi:sortase (surface protein transpeptidase)
MLFEESAMSTVFLSLRCRFAPVVLAGALAVVIVAGCQGAADVPAPTPEPVSIQAAAVELQGTLTEIPPLAQDQATGPVRLRIPAINLDVPVIAMGWRLEMSDGVRTTVWDVPYDEAGWHINSAKAGAAGNTVITGRQLGGPAVFAPLALGQAAVGQEVLVTDGDGITFVYRIVEVTDPIAVTGATAQEQAQAAAYFAPTSEARLTLVTGWPEFTTTHRIFVVAEFVGVLR